MKYIRTKDGIYEVKDNFIVLKEQELYLPHFQDHIIAQADTIEKLCDEFVIVCGAFKFPQVISQRLSFDINFEKTHHSKYHDTYGAIWTKKGLIYVAKMNEKGELELL